MTRKAVIFDMDDTLYPERAFVLSGFRAVAAWAEQRLGLPAAQSAAVLGALYADGVRGDTFDRWLVSCGVRDSGTIIPQLVEVYRQHTPDIQPFAGVPRLLGVLRRSYSLGLVSDGYLAVQQRKLAALGLGPAFDAIVFSDELGREAWKPSSRPFALVCERLGTAPQHAVYIADNARKDFAGARLLDMKTIWLRRPDGEYAAELPPEPAYAAHAEVADLAELPALLCALYAAGER